MKYVAIYGQNMASFDDELGARNWIMSQKISDPGGASSAYIIHNGKFILHEHFGYDKTTGYSGYSGFCGCRPYRLK